MASPLKLRKISPDRTVRDEIGHLLKLGFEYGGTNASGHHLISHPKYGAMRPMSSTPKNPRTWRIAHRRQVANLMGLSLWQFERLLAGQPLTSSRRSRKRRAPRRAVSLRIAGHDLEPDPDEPTIRHGGDLRVRFYRCRACMRPWNDEARFPAEKCPKCDSIDIDRNPARTAA